MKISVRSWIEKALEEGFPEEVLLCRIREALGTEEIPEEIEANRRMMEKLSEALYIPWGYLFLQPHQIEHLYYREFFMRIGSEVINLMREFFFAIDPVYKGVSLVLLESGDDPLHILIHSPDEVEIWIQEKPWESMKKDEESTQKIREFLRVLFDFLQFLPSFR